METYESFTSRLSLTEIDARIVDSVKKNDTAMTASEITAELIGADPCDVSVVLASLKSEEPKIRFNRKLSHFIARDQPMHPKDVVRLYSDVIWPAVTRLANQKYVVLRNLNGDKSRHRPHRRFAADSQEKIEHRLEAEYAKKPAIIQFCTDVGTEYTERVKKLPERLVASVITGSFLGERIFTYYETKRGRTFVSDLDIALFWEGRCPGYHDIVPLTFDLAEKYRLKINPRIRRVSRCDPEYLEHLSVHGLPLYGKMPAPASDSVNL